MEEILAYTISAGIVGFGIWIFVGAMDSGAPVLLACAALIPIVIGTWSARGDH
jgi:hypothetical protein